MVFSDDERQRIGSALDALVPGAASLGAVDYVEQLLSAALEHDPPRIWAGPGAWAGDGWPEWIDLGPWERQAWQQRIGDLRAVYQRLLDGVPEEGDQRVLHAHACEATYGDPAYGGNRGSGGWTRIAFPEPIFPPARQQ